MESDLLFSCQGSFLESFIHPSDCGRYGAPLSFDTAFFSENVLESVSEDLVAELEDGDLFASLGSNGISCETPLSSQNGDQKGRLFSSPSEDQNSDVLHSVPYTSSNNLNGFCDPSLNLGQVPLPKEVIPDRGEGGEGVNALGSWKMATSSLSGSCTKMAVRQLNCLSLGPKGERKCLGDGGNVLHACSPFDISTSQVSFIEPTETELSIPSLLVVPGKHDISGQSDEDSQDLGAGVSAYREPAANSAIDVSLSGLSNAGNSLGAFEMSALRSPVVEGKSRELSNVVLFTSANFEGKPPCSLDYPEAFQRVDIESDKLSPLPTPVQFSQSRMIQRSFSSNALVQLGGKTLLERRTEPSLLTQTAPLYSSVKRSGSTAAQPQVQLTDAGLAAGGPSFNSMRRVFSTGDIQSLNGLQMVQEAGSPLHSDSTMPEEGIFKIGRYTIEERKSRICRYRQKRNERNFNKKIKYACRKTLADSRPRIRGRFAKNEEVDDILVRQGDLHSHEDEDEQSYLRAPRLSCYWGQPL